MDLTAQGRALLKAMGGNLSQVRATPYSMSRWGLDRPESVLHVVPESLAALCLALPDEFLKKSDSALEAETPVTRLDRRVRLRFWDEYESANKENRPMKMLDVVQFSGVPSWESYEARLKDTPALLAWLMNPPAEYKLQMREAQELGLRRLTDILELPMIDATTGKVNTGVGLLILQAIKLVDQRLHGSPTQKNVNVNVEAGQMPQNATLSMSEVDKKIAELEARLHGPAAQAGSAPLGTPLGPFPSPKPEESSSSEAGGSGASDTFEAEFEHRSD
jgi:hypothetical protein